VRSVPEITVTRVPALIPLAAVIKFPTEIPEELLTLMLVVLVAFAVTVVLAEHEEVVIALNVNVPVAVAPEVKPATTFAVPAVTEIEVGIARALTTASADRNSVGAREIAPTRAATAARRKFLEIHRPLCIVTRIPN
jgi:hypothetical protein